MTLSIAKTDADDGYYVVNQADRHKDLNSLEGAPEIMKELRRATIEIILRQARQAGQQVVKVAMAAKPPVPAVRGYATFLRFLQGSSLAELEQKLGFKRGVLQAAGAYIYSVDALALNGSNIAPRGNTDWSAGVTPRDLDNLSRKHGVNVHYHDDYPAASQPIIQFTILDPVPFTGQPRLITGSDVV